jgi:predicted deacylase
MQKQGQAKVRQSKRPAVLITQAIHGNEYQQIVDRLVLDYSNGKKTLPGLEDFLEGGGLVYLVPIVNPDGYERRQRENRQGYDLNRDWPSDFTGVEGFLGNLTRSARRHYS